jgi:hypothetical protein
MKQQDTDAGGRLILLLKRQKHLYRQLKDLVSIQQQVTGSNRGGPVLKIISRRRQLVRDLVELNDKLLPMKKDWKKVSSQVAPHVKTAAYKIALEMEDIVADIRALCACGTYDEPDMREDLKFEELISGAKLQYTDGL